MRMRLGVIALAGFAIGLSMPAGAGTLENSLSKLGPEERARQVCAIRGVMDIRKSKKLPSVDRVQASTADPAAFDGSVVTATSGAVRSKDRWYALNFTCAVTPDQMKVVSFAYKVGAEIPEEKWEDLGLWR